MPSKTLIVQDTGERKYCERSFTRKDLPEI